MVKYVSIILFCLVTGCAVTGGGAVETGWSKGASQPRALLWGVSQPQCVFFCTVTISVNESERSGGSLTSGDISTSVKASPSASLSLGQPMPLPVAPIPMGERE